MEILYIVAISAFAALTQASVGFGFAVVFTPLLSLVMSARDAITLSLLLSMSLSMSLYLTDRPRAPFRSILPMFAAATAVTPLGVWVLAVADERVLRACIGIAVLGSVAGTLLGQRPAQERPERLREALAVGVLSGLFRGATSMGGPPVVIYEHWRGAASDAIRRRLLAFFALTGVSGVVIGAAGGVFTTTSILHSLAGVPTVAIALYGGRWIRPRLSEFWFRMLSMALLVFMGGVSLVGALR